MALTNIEYGSLASSETLNKNFTYLDNRITETAAAITANISSILSNIATLNANFTELSGNLSDALQTMQSDINTHKTTVGNAINSVSMKPNWLGLSPVTVTNFVAPSNGYILAVPKSNAKGIITINGNPVNFKYNDNSYDNASLMAALPLNKDDIVQSALEFKAVYFLPALEINLS